MAELETLARPYARAAFEYALEGNSLQVWTGGLGVAAALCADDKVRALMVDPARTARSKADAFVALISDECPEALRNFLRLLADYKRLPLLPQILDVFLLMKANQEKSINLQVTSAFEIDAEQAQTLAAAMGEKLGRQVNVNTAVDRGLIGGALIRTGDLVIDGTVRGKLGKLVEAMNS